MVNVGTKVSGGPRAAAGDRWRAPVLANLGVAGVYALVGALVEVFFSSIGLFPAPLWPSAGIGVVAGAIYGWSIVPGLFLGSLAVNALSFSAPLGVALPLSLTNALGPVVGIVLARRFARRTDSLFGVRDVASFTMFAVVLHAAITGAMGAMVMYLGGRILSGALGRTFLEWWLSDAWGTLALAPPVLLWLLDPATRAGRNRRGEWLGVSLALTAGSIALFLWRGLDGQADAALPFLLLVPCAWLAERCTSCEAYTEFCDVVLIAVIMTATGYGPFAGAGIQRPLFFVGIFTVTGAALILSCGALASNRRRAERALRSMVATLEQRVAERTAALQASEALLRQVVEDLPLPISLVRPEDDRLLFANGQARRLFGVDPAMEPDRRESTFWCRLEDRERIFAAVTDGEPVQDLETELWNARREVITALVSASLTRFGDTPVVLLGAADITDRKRSEQAVRESERKLRLLTDNMTDVVWAVDPGLRYTFVSQSVEQARGIPPDALLGRSIFEFLSPESGERAGRAIASATATAAAQKQVRAEIRLELEVMRPDGIMLECETCMTLLLDPYGRLLGLQGVTRDIRERKILEAELHRLATTDALTGLLNRRAFLDRLGSDIARSLRYGRPLTLAMVDLDHFKRINDRFGHGVGDEVLVAFAGVCRTALRDADVVGRLGGEEFAVLLPETAIRRAASTAERLREAVEALRIPADGGPVAPTASIGLAMLGPGDDASRLMARADHALYAAKEQGRNRVVSAGE